MIFWSYTAIPDLFNAVVCAACFQRLYTSLRASVTPSAQAIHLRNAYGLLVLAYLIFALPVLFTPANSEILTAAFLVGHGFLFLACVDLLAIPTSFFLPHYQPRIYRLTQLLALFLVIVGIIFPPLPHVNFFSRVTQWNSPPLLDILYGVWLGVSLLVVMLFFFHQSVQSRYRDVRIRALFIGGGLFILLASTAFFYPFESSVLSLVSNIFSVVGFLVTAIGVFFRPRRPMDPLIPTHD
ncbi:MAG: hypothetical protein HYZ08_00835 [Candidatus Kerfeldbacteria bacterium]|nr:hypothetical protein [Candidatus Kerfeldbacteria bacterium]